METGTECYLIGYPNIISFDCAKKIVEEMQKDICKIIVEEERGTGFFCKIPFPNKESMQSVLITNNHIVNENLLNNANGKIKIYIEEEENEKVINLKNRLKYTNKEYDTTIIEIKEEDNINNFMELDEGIINNIINNKNENIKYKEQTVYIIHYPEGNLSVSYGIINDIFEDEPYNFLHKCNTRKGSSGSPIINLNNKIIGIHKKSHDKNYNEGTFLNYPIKDFISKNKTEKLKDKKIIKIESPVSSTHRKSLPININIKNIIKKEEHILFKKFKIINKLAEGDFTQVYFGSNILTNESVAIKVECKKSSDLSLESESFFLFEAKGIGIPEILGFGKINHKNVLVEPFLGKSLYNVFEEKGKLSLSDICIISKQLIDRIQWVHSKNIIHRDIKPDNCLTGRINEGIIYLIDFSISKKYRSNKTGKHIKYSFTGKFIGSILFSSMNALKGLETSRRDDLESIAYMIIYLMKGKLPWENGIGANEKEKFINAYQMKKSISIEDLCKNLPYQIMDFIRYVKKLEFESEPNYDYLRGLIIDILLKRNIIYNNSLKLSSNIYSRNIYKDIEKNNFINIKNNFKEKFHQTTIKHIKKRDNIFISLNCDSIDTINKIRFFPINDNKKLFNTRNRTESDLKYKSRKEKCEEKLKIKTINISKIVIVKDE